MIFEEAFLQSQNPDCLAQVLSFLTCQDLANVARTCKVLQETIFDETHDEGNVNLIWHGAEEALTNPRDMQSIFLNKSTRMRVGSNAREHCHLFAVASKAAKAYELSGEVEEDRIKVDGVLANLMNVRGFDAEGIAEKKALGALDTRTMEEASKDFKFGKTISMNSMSNEEREEWEEMKRKSREQQIRRKEKWEELTKLTAPTKTYHHDIFLRITRDATGEVISEGFCSTTQNLPWHAGLDDLGLFRGQIAPGLKVILDFESLRQSEEIQSFFGAPSRSENPFGMRTLSAGINLTAVVIDRRNCSIQCLFQHDKTEEMLLGSIRPEFGGPFRGLQRYDFHAQPRWGMDSITLGPSIAHDSYYAGFSFSLLSLYAGEQTDEAPPLPIPILEVNVQEDTSAYDIASMRNIKETFPRAGW